MILRPKLTNHHTMDLMMRARLVALSLFVFRFGVEGQQGLSYDFYDTSCPQIEAIVRSALQPIFLTDPTAPAAFLRLLFHDCQVQGCDASILVDTTSNNVPSEMGSGKNFGIRKRESINIVKSMVELECPEQVSCSDILVLAAREGVVRSGGPLIKVPLGRRDSSVAPSYKLADSLLPSAAIGVDGTLQLFSKKGMTVDESVAIIGAHTLGVTHCVNILNRLNKLPDEGANVEGMAPGFEAFLRLNCPGGILTSNASFVLNDPTTLAFDNHYYSNVIGGYGVLRIDSKMVTDPRTSMAVDRFAADEDEFFRVFSSAFVKLSSSGVLTRNQGVVRKSCNELD